MAKKYRKNVAALIQVGQNYLACHRSSHDVWQCVQGGVEENDVSLEEALFREINEELGVERKAGLKILSQAHSWRRYDFPVDFKKTDEIEKYAGQEQMWFFVSLDHLDRIDLGKSQGEFSEVKLVSLEELLDLYPRWKKEPFVDFCKELGLT